jgi:hypothetical protein
MTAGAPRFESTDQEMSSDDEDPSEGGRLQRTDSLETLPKTGTVCAQWVRYGKPGCRCARGELHGPYYAWFSREYGQLRKRYVPLADVAAVREACDARRTHKRAARLAREDAWQRWRRLAEAVREVEHDA